jgi:serine/threonine protein phosphatase PrpC
VRVAWAAGTALIVMADGVGGLPFGGQAAEAATSHAFRRLRRELPRALAVGVEGVRTLLLSTVWSTAGHVAAEARARGLRRTEDGLCTTLILAVALAEVYVVVWIGDGGAHVLRGKEKVERLLVPHKSPDAPTLLEAAIGPETDGAPSWSITPRRPGDVFLVTTDGVADQFDAGVVARLHAAIARSRTRAKPALQDLLGELASQKNAFGRYTFTDNLTAALVLTAGMPVTDAPEAHEQDPTSMPSPATIKTRSRGRAAAIAQENRRRSGTV